MPACAVHLLSLFCPIPEFLTILKNKTSLKPLTISRVIRWIILPTSISTSELLARNIHWDLLVILPSTSPLPEILSEHIAHQFSVQAGVPSRLLQNFPQKNHDLLHPSPSSIPPLTGSLDKPLVSSSSQDLALSPELRTWITSFSQNGGESGKGAVSMLNLLAFKSSKKEDYLKYGAEFSKSIGSKRGGDAKIVGSVIHDKGNEGEEEGGWDEIALAHYPSILHFADMLGSEDYQEVNRKWRVPSLRDTCILCTSEVGLDDDGREKANL